MGTGDILKRQEREADHSPSYSTEVKNGGAIPTFLHCVEIRYTYIVLLITITIRNAVALDGSVFSSLCFSGCKGKIVPVL
jgi:hypothetical protein